MEMLESIDKNEYELINSSNAKASTLASRINFNLLRRFKDFLVMFRIARLSLSSESKPTMQRTINTCIRLRDHVATCGLFTASFPKLLDIYDCKVMCKINDNHRMACALDPWALETWRQQNFFAYDEDQMKLMLMRIEAFDKLPQLFEETQPEPQVIKDDDDIFMKPCGAESISQLDREAETANSLVSEFRMYLDESSNYCTKFASLKKSVFELWGKLKPEYPKLFKVALHCLSMQPTNNGSERMFNKCNEIITVKSNRIGDNTLNDRLFVNKNREMFFQIALKKLNSIRPKCSTSFQNKILCQILPADDEISKLANITHKKVIVEADEDNEGEEVEIAFGDTPSDDDEDDYRHDDSDTEISDELGLEADFF